MSQTFPDPRPSQLRRMKIGALALLVAMIAGFVTSHAMGGQGGWAWVRAFCEAATVGALADWFAVVALFRHPMGIPIPHTAIIPSNKDRVADSLAVFVRDHFLDPAALVEKLKVFDPAARLGDWLSGPDATRRLSQGARRAALEGMRLLDEDAVRGVIQSFVTHSLQRWNAAGSAGELLTFMTKDGRHQELLDGALERLGGYLGEDAVKQRVSLLLVKYARQEWPRLVRAAGLVGSVEGIGDKLADRLAAALMSELHEVLTTPDHPVRLNYEGWFVDYIERLRVDPLVTEQVEAMKQRFIAHPEVQAYTRGLWDDLRSALLRDLSSEESVLSRHLEATLVAMGARVALDSDLREAINLHVLGSARTLAESLREGVTEHISRTVKAWDERRLVTELELSVGRDLQYIRFNGTLVGGLIGLALHAAVLVAQG